jgi:formamidopyrimidine-DNA glycosylase
MPELPEVETVVRTVAPHLLGRTILEARFTSKFVTPGNRAALARKLAGRTIQSVRRRGKFIVIELDQSTLVIHLGMTGNLLSAGKPEKHTHGFFRLNDGELLYNDPRQFGRIELTDLRVRKLGPEPLEITLEDFTKRMKRRAQVKPLLMNQAFLAGLGNIYVDESLFRSGIHPLTIAEKLSAARVARLHQTIRELLIEAIEHRGSTISDYRDADGAAGGFQLRHQVYGREGGPCVVCQTPIRKILVAQRGTHFCPKCQPGPKTGRKPGKRS